MAGTGDAVDFKNGLLGFSNPNYHLDDAVNCNAEDCDQNYDDLYQELDSVCNFTRRNSSKGRRNYANLDLESMGIDLSADPNAPNANSAFASATSATSTSTGCSTLAVNTVAIDDDDNRNTACSKTSQGACADMTDGRYLDYFMGMDTWSRTSLRPDLIENVESTPIGAVKQTTISESPDSIGAMGMDLGSPDGMELGSCEDQPRTGMPQLNNNLYALSTKSRSPVPGFAKLISDTDKLTSPTPSSSSASSTCSTSCLFDKDDEILPPGWEKHEDGDGPYYWHIKSGTIQRDVPPPAPPNQRVQRKMILREENEPLIDVHCAATPAESTTGDGDTPTLSADSIRRKPQPKVTPEKEPIRFAVRSLGWVEIAEDDLTPERSSKAVNKCIVDLSLGRNDILDVVGRWGDGKDLFMDLDEKSLKLVDPEKLTVLNKQPIHTIRVWGVGRDNGRDFAYVARDSATRKHMCHVFRCDSPARTIANTLRDICKKIMIERSFQQSIAKAADSNASGGGTGIVSVAGGSRTGLVRPTNLPTEQRRNSHRGGQSSYSAQSFPTPMEEPKKVIKVHYLGMVQVSKPTGMEVLNDAIDMLNATVPMEKWQFVNVAVAPSTITISETGDAGKQLAECRVRFLSFLGIGKNVKHCAFIMHTAQDQYMAHVFHCEPSSGALCKTIEAACKLRYQKCLDAHPQGTDRRQSDLQSGKGLGAALKSVFGNLTARRTRSSEV